MPMTLLHVPSTLSEPSPPGTLRITLTNPDQGRHLLAALRGHCEADHVPGSNGAALDISMSDTGNRGVLRRVDAWLREFGVDSASLELDGRTYRLTKT
jgi:hypothetical protein